MNIRKYIPKRVVALIVFVFGWAILRRVSKNKIVKNGVEN